jgi:hypothetical protein
LKWDVIGRGPFDGRTELQTLNLKLKTGEAFAVASDVPELIEGAHADHLLYVFDESKRLDVATPIPTPYGWTTMGEVEVGDEVLDEEGCPCLVTSISPIVDDRPCCQITFEDGASIVADDGHLWAMLPYARRQTWGMQHLNDPRYKKSYQQVVDWREYWDQAHVVETSDLVSKPKGSAIPTCRPLVLSAIEASIDPYVLGAWLGDGASHDGAIYVADDEIIREVRCRGYSANLRPSSVGTGALAYGILGLRVLLRQENLLCNKHIPSKYLRGSYTQRLDLLRGLMDTDGTNMGGKGKHTPRVSFTTVKYHLAHQVAELVRTFGWKVQVTKHQGTLDGVEKQMAYILRWSADICPFILPRKIQKWSPRSAQASSSTVRTIQSIERVPSVPTRCIAVDSPRHLYLAGESFIPTHNSVIGETFDAAEGAFSGTGEALALSISTPGDTSGRFYEIQSRKPGFEDWTVRHVTLEEAVLAGRISQEWADQRKMQWGEHSAVYQNRVLGEFATAEEDCLIPLSWVEAANQRWLEWQDTRAREGNPSIEKLTSVGVDIARSGPDDTVLALRYKHVITELRHTRQEDTMQTTGRVVTVLQRYGGVGMIDVIGIGAGVFDRLRELHHQVIPFNAAAGTKVTDSSGELGFANVRSAAWWHLRELLDPANVEPIALPPEDRLIGDLTAPKHTVTSSGKIQIEGKDKIKERLGRSTDDGDAVVQAFALELLDPDLGEFELWGGSDYKTGQHSELEALVRARGCVFPGD